VAASVTVKSYLCPSAPERQIDYGPYFVSLGLPNQGPFVIGATDYAPVRGAHNNFRTACAPTMPNPSNASGVLGVFGVANGQSLVSGKAKLTDVADGLSNTIVFTEASGRHQVYAKGRQVTPNAPGQIGWTLNAGFFDYNTTIQVRGFSNDGLTVDGGCCVINCTNGRTSPFTQEQIYAFHTGGANALRGDGSVQFLKEGTAPGVLAAMITRAGGEVFTEN
jgi:prepilin-type processing-associated H-X9-DG protein